MQFSRHVPSRRFFLRRQILALPLCCGVVSLALSGCEKKTPNPPVQKVRLGVGNWIGYAPFFYAERAGIDTQHGIDIELVRIGENIARRDSLFAKKLDVNITTVDMAAITAIQHPDLRLFFATDASTGGDGLIARSDIASIGALKGKKIAVEEGTPSHFFLLFVLKAAGLGPGDVQLVPARAEDTPELLRSSSADAIATWEPWLSRAKEYGFHVLASTATYPDLIVDVLETREDYLMNNPETLARIIDVWNDALAKCGTEEAMVAMADAYKKSPEQFRAMLPEMKWLDLEENRKRFLVDSPSAIERLLDEATTVWTKAGRITGTINSTDIVAESVLRGTQGG